jgi:hypothetical protein
MNASVCPGWLFWLLIPISLACMVGCRGVADLPDEIVDNDGGDDSDTDTGSDTGSDPINPEINGTYRIDDGSRLCTLAASDTHVALTYGLGDEFSGYPLRFAVFPWDSPESATISVLPSACQQDNEAWVKPYSVENDFAVWLRTWDSAPGLPFGCAASRVVMGNDGSVIDGPVAYQTPFYAEVWHAWFPDGVLDQDNGLLTGQIYDLNETDNEVLFRLDHLHPDGTQDSLSDAVYLWPDPFGPNDGIDLVFSRNRSFSDGDNIISLAIDHRWDGVSHLVMGATTMTGNETMPPTEVVEVPGNPDATTHIVVTLAQRGDEIAGVFIHWNVEGSQPYTAGESFVIDFDGALVSGPNDIPELSWDQEYNSIVQFDGLAWNGSHFGFCYRPLNKGYKFLALNSVGTLAGEPISILGNGELPIENGFCDVIALSDGRFLVAMTVRAETAEVERGTYVTYISVDADTSL